MALRESAGHGLLPSRTLALGFLWDTTDWFWWQTHYPTIANELTIERSLAAALATPLARELAGGDFFSDEPTWARTTAGRVISCVGVVDRSNCLTEAHENTSREHYPQATYLIAVPDAGWLGHLAPGMEWNSRAWNRDGCTTCKPTWRTSDVLALASGIEADAAFDRMPILADALQDAGCDDSDVLDHCRGPGPHVRGCWVVDTLLRLEETQSRTADA